MPKAFGIDTLINSIDRQTAHFDKATWNCFHEVNPISHHHPGSFKFVKFSQEQEMEFKCRFDSCKLRGGALLNCKKWGYAYPPYPRRLRLCKCRLDSCKLRECALLNRVSENPYICLLMRLLKPMRYNYSGS
jgi:hypothetical protein